jgi:hypothetical protein
MNSDQNIYIFHTVFLHIFTLPLVSDSSEPESEVRCLVTYIVICSTVRNVALNALFFLVSFFSLVVLHKPDIPVDAYVIDWRSYLEGLRPSGDENWT